MTQNNDTPASTEEVDQIARHIDDLVRQNLSQDRDVYLLSKLGIDLGPDRKRIEEKFGLSVREFLKQFTSYNLAVFGAHQNIYGIVRTGVNPSNVSPNFKTRRYNRQFWAAFISSDHPVNRYINVDTLAFDIDEERVKDGAGRVVAISPEYQVAWSNPNKNSIASKNITEWLRANQLEPERFYFSGSETTATGSHTVLDKLLSSLSDDQLRRVSLPLDVINSLRKRRF